METPAGTTGFRPGGVPPGIKETPLHIAIMHMVSIDFLPEDLIIAHPPNGGIRDKAEAYKLKRMGVLPGLPDLICYWPTRIGLTPAMDSGFIEIKTPTGQLTEEQIIFRKRVQAMSGKYAIARDYETVRDTLISWGVKCQNRVKFT